MEKEIIRFKGIKKYYKVGNQEVKALDGVDVTIRKNEYVAIMGPSGSRKMYNDDILGVWTLPHQGTIHSMEMMPSHGMTMIWP